MKQTGGAALARQLVNEGITDIFGIPGIQLDWAVDGLRQCRDDVRFIVPRHEQATSYMADGYARSTGRIGTCMVVPGPGLLNAMAGLATAYACNSRVLCLAGDIHSTGRGKGVGLLHEIRNQTEILASVSKWTDRPQSTAEIPAKIHAAVKKLKSGQPRPVSVEFSHDLLSSSDEIELITDQALEGPLQPDPLAIEAAAALLSNARFPVIYVGGGALAAGASEALRAFAERLDAPVITGENGRGAISDRHSLALNTLAGRAVMPHADVVVVVGSRFVDTMLGKPAWPSERCKFIYINVDPTSWLAPRRADIAIQADARLGLEALAQEIAARPAQIAAKLASVRQWADDQAADIEPQLSWLRALRSALPDDGFFVNELTQVGYLGRFMFPVYQPNTFITPGYQGTLGFGFATALGVAVGNPGRTVISINGDGGFGWNLQELATARKYGLKVIAVVFNDGYFGNVRTMQKDQFGDDYGADLCNPDFAQLAGAFHVPYARADTPDRLEAIIKEAVAGSGPLLIEVPVSNMPSPWHLMRLQTPPFAKASKAVPPNPLGEPA